MLKGVKNGDKFYITLWDVLSGEAILLKKGLFNAKIKILEYTPCYNCQGPLINNEMIITKKEIADYTTNTGKTYSNYEKFDFKQCFKKFFRKNSKSDDMLPF